MITAEMIVMVVQPYPVMRRGCTVALCAGWCRLAACRCITLVRGYHLQLTCSIHNGGGSDSDGTWETGGKRWRKTAVEKRCDNPAFATLLVELLFHCFPVCDAENDRAKNWKDHICSWLTWSDGNGTPPLWHSCIFDSFVAFFCATGRGGARNGGDLHTYFLW
jgi:hypothetical protein